MPGNNGLNFKSKTITSGVERAPNRAMLRAVGFGDDDFHKPIVGVANAYSTITPCNLGLQTLADRAVESLRAAGTMPHVFGTITVSDGISMGTEGMKYSLVSREVIADSIETAADNSFNPVLGTERGGQAETKEKAIEIVQEFMCDRMFSGRPTKKPYVVHLDHVEELEKVDFKILKRWDFELTIAVFACLM